MDISIITSENRRLFPAAIYPFEDTENNNPILNIDD